MKLIRKISKLQPAPGTPVEKPVPVVGDDFEAAITAAGFGKFNYFLIISSLPMSWMAMFETTTMSYVFPAAQCDFSLTLEDKGMLNAITYGGTIVSSLFWGFLFDTFGRKKLLLIGFLLNGITVALSGLSQNLAFLMTMKFLGGFLMSGPFAASNTYLSELHSEKYRSRVPLLIGFWMAIGCIYLPFLASFVLRMEFTWFLGNFVLHPWSLFLLVNSIPAFLSAFVFILLPESPKFLMSIGRNEEALMIFREIYSFNTGDNPENYPVKMLRDEKQQVDGDEKKGNAWNQLKILFRFPHLKPLFLVCILQLCTVTSQNTLRLWLPQLFQSVNDYKFLHNGTSSSFCEMLSYTMINSNVENSSNCFVNTNNAEVYENAMIVYGATAIAYLIAGILVNILGQNMLLILSSLIATIFSSGIYFSPNGEMSTLFITVFSSFASLTFNAVVIIIVNLFPTQFRTMALSISMIFGRGFAMIGNAIFPFLLEIGCAPPFLLISTLMLGCFIFSLIVPRKNENFV